MRQLDGIYETRKQALEQHQAELKTIAELEAQMAAFDARYREDLGLPPVDGQTTAPFTLEEIQEIWTNQIAELAEQESLNRRLRAMKQERMGTHTPPVGQGPRAGEF